MIIHWHPYPLLGALIAFWIGLAILVFSCRSQPAENSAAAKIQEKAPAFRATPPAKVPTATPDAGNIRVGKVTPTTSLKLRKGAGSQFPIVGALSPGEPLDVLGPRGAKQTIDGKTDYWFEVRRQSGDTGFAFGAFLAPISKAVTEEGAEQALPEAMATPAARMPSGQ